MQIFLQKYLKILGNFYGYFSKGRILSKTALATYLATFVNIWLLFNLTSGRDWWWLEQVR